MKKDGKGIPEIKEMEYTVWKERKGYKVGITSAGDLFIGYDHNYEFYKDSPENREFVLSQWEFNKGLA